MEADWEVELGGDAPVIEAYWPGLVDLRMHPEQARMLPEAQQLGGLAETLVRLNANTSPVWTSKCDVWEVDEFDPDELDAPLDSATHAIACYIDILPKSYEQKESHASMVAACKGLCVRLHAVAMRCCRADLIIRRAIMTKMGRAVMIDGGEDLVVTAYVTACGSSIGEARAVLRSALDAFADAVSSVGQPADAASKLQ